MFSSNAQLLRFAMYQSLFVSLISAQTRFEPIPFVSFDQSMEFSKGDPHNKLKNVIVKFCRELYNANNLTKIQPQKDPIIPQRIHLIWLGPKNPPAIFKDCLTSIKKHLPHWQVKIWRDEDVPGLKLYNQKYYDEEINYGAKSDLLRYEILYKFGGVYIDVDMVLLKSLDILHHTYEFYTGLEANDNEAILGNAIIASIPGHPILKDCIEMVKHHRTGDLHDWNVVHRTGPRHFEKSFFSEAMDRGDRIIAFPKSFFFPISFCAAGEDDACKAACIKNETFCVHHWSGSWLIK